MITVKRPFTVNITALKTRVKTKHDLLNGISVDVTLVLL